MNGILCLLIGHAVKRKVSCHSFVDWMECGYNRCYTRYDVTTVCTRCQKVIEDLGSYIRKGAEQ